MKGKIKCFPRVSAFFEINYLNKKLNVFYPAEVPQMVTVKRKISWHYVIKP